MKIKRPVPPTQDTRNLDTAARVRAALDQLTEKEYVVLAKIPSSKKDVPPYEIRMGRSLSVYCKCNGFKYRQQCRHMDRFRREWKTVVFSFVETKMKKEKR